MGKFVACASYKVIDIYLLLSILPYHIISGYCVTIKLFKTC